VWGVIVFLGFPANALLADQSQLVDVGAPALPAQVGAAQFDKYLPLLAGKRVALVVNHTAVVGDTHLVDQLLAQGVNIVKVFAPEHGFRGQQGAGETIADAIDARTKLPIVSLYGKQKKPSPTMLSDVDVLIFDIQDVGVRFYTYISTMHLVMEAAAEAGKHVIIFDRPNPNIAHVAGPVLDLRWQSFVGMHPIPVLHGMTVGELALMIRGEQWLNTNSELALTVIKVQDYHDKKTYSLPIAPSPNLPNDQAIQWYASLCLFEPTHVSIGRGSQWPFQLIGHPELSLAESTFSVTPRSMPSAPTPKWQDEPLQATLIDELDRDLSGFDLSILASTHSLFKSNKIKFFTSSSFFDKLVGNDSLRLALESSKSLIALQASWQTDIDSFLTTRKPYLLYPRLRQYGTPAVSQPAALPAPSNPLKHKGSEHVAH
jgi:uncharacterized protein YbbC (DUF1343 family)